MAHKNEKESIRTAALEMLSDSDLSAVVGGTKSKSGGAKPQTFLTYTFKTVYVTSISAD